MPTPDHRNETEPLHITLVSRRFWPCSSSTELAVLELASELKRKGHAVNVITVRWQRKWPARFSIQGIPVTRITRPSGSVWSGFRFQRHLIRTIAEQSPSPDGVIVFGLGDEALGRVKELQQKPIVVRVDYRQTPYADWLPLRTQKVRQALERATAVFADSEFSAQRLVSYGVPTELVNVVPDGLHPCTNTTRTTAEQIAARLAVSNAHPVLSIEPKQPLAVCGSPYDEDSGVMDLLEAWKQILHQYPDAKLWLLGDGRLGSKVWKQICALDLVYSVIMPGYFDDLETVFAAADIYLHPLRTNRACSMLVRAMGHGLCPIATETEFTRPLVQANVCGLLVPAGQPHSLAQGILQSLDHRDLRYRLGNAARTRITESHSIREQAKTYAQLIARSLQTIE